MKKFLKITFGTIAGLLLLTALVPFIFKDKIKAKLDEEIAKNVDAKVFYNADHFSVSIFSNFPNIAVSLGEFGLVGQKEAFKGDTLANINKFKLVLDIMSVISGDQMKINGIYLDKPYLLTKFDKNGAFSWDVTFPDSSASDETTTESADPLKININKWEIVDGHIIYIDESMPVYVEMKHMNHSGKGNMTMSVFDLITKTNIESMSVEFDGVKYFNRYKVDADAQMNIDLDKSVYTFKENEFAINDFKFGFDGFVAMPDTNINMDIKFNAKETSFKNLISLVPAVFMNGYDGLKADGKISFDGYTKGTFNAVSMPGFGINLNVNDAMMQYPDLPTSINKIFMDLAVDCKTGNMDKDLLIDLKKFDMNFGAQPINAQVKMLGLEPMDIQKCKVNMSNINLAEMTKLFPVDSVEVKGLFSLLIDAQGKYSEIEKLMPTVQANASLKNGFVKYLGFPEALESMNMEAAVISDGNMSTSKAELKSFNMTLDKQPFAAKAAVVNFDDANYDFSMNGILDLAKINKLFPTEGTDMSGVVNIKSFATQGILSDIDAGRYNKTNTSGEIDIKNLSYKSTDFVQGMKLNNANYTFTPKEIAINAMNGSVGKSEINVTGKFSNYMAFLFGTTGDTTMYGKMNFASNSFDVNEWMSEDTTATASTTEEEPLTVLEIPKDIDFVFSSDIKKVLYDNMTLENLAGDIIMRDGILSMKGVAFNTLDGSVKMNGAYNAQDLNNPKFDYDMDVKDMDIKKSYTTFNTIQKMAPLAENMDGKFAMQLKVNGDLGQDMMPKYETMNGNGLMKIASAQLKGNKVMTSIANITKVNGLDPLPIKDTKITFKIEDGKLVVDPFDMKAGNTNMNISGYNQLDGNINYLIKMDVPAGAAGVAANNALSSLTGQPATNNGNIKVNLRAEGPYENPTVKPEGAGEGSPINTVKTAVVDKAKEEIDKAKAEAEAKARQEAEKAKQEAEARVRAEQERLRLEAEAKKKEAEEKAKKEAENKAKDLLKNKKLW